MKMLATVMLIGEHEGAKSMLLTRLVAVREIMTMLGTVTTTMMTMVTMIVTLIVVTR